jgi:hypothetical protein
MFVFASFNAFLFHFCQYNRLLGKMILVPQVMLPAVPPQSGISDGSAVEAEQP